MIHVVALALQNDRGEILLTQRPEGKHLAGLWEFPGGKREAGESRLEALLRECREELAYTPPCPRPLMSLHHQYAEKTIHLDVFLAHDADPLVYGAEGQPLRWVPCIDLHRVHMPPADAPIIQALNTPPLQRWRWIRSSDAGHRPQTDARVDAHWFDGAKPDASQLHRLRDARQTVYVSAVREKSTNEGLMQAPAAHATAFARKIAQCNSLKTIERAHTLGADCVLIHFCDIQCDWQQLAKLALPSRVPVLLASTELTADHLPEIWRHHAQGLVQLITES